MKKLIIFLTMVGIMCLGGCSKSPTGPESSATATPTATAIPTHQVKYMVTGTAASVSITYTNASEGTSQISNASVPWETSFIAKDGAFVYISAQNLGDSGDITVTILRDGQIFKRSTSSGAYVIATASGSI